MNSPLRQRAVTCREPGITSALTAVLSGVLLVAAGCATPRDVRATAYDVEVRLDPAEHTLAAEATLTLRPLDSAAAQWAANGPVTLAFELHEDLQVTDVRAAGARVTGVTSRRPPAADQAHDDGAPGYRIHVVRLDRSAPEMTLTFAYRGKLYQDIAAGEKRGQIHNFVMAAHVAPEGTYLEPGGHWYPTPVSDNDEQIDPELLLADWRVRAELRADDSGGETPATYELVATGYPREAPAQAGDEATRAYAWRSPHKLLGFTITGGPHDVWSRVLGDIEISVHMQHADDPQGRSANEQIAAMYLERTAGYIERYEPLVGPFPYKRFTIVENFFSSGFAFPTMTLFGPMVMRMGENSFRHGYVDHELLHSWWGCGIEVDARDGNWCEGLASYGANYYGFVIDGDEEGARKKRRDQCNFLSRIKPENDKPLGTFGLEDGAGRSIAYSKGSAVFHMLARKIGQESFWAAMRLFTERYVGRCASWDDLKALFEEASGRNLDVFFDQWVRGSGAPLLTLAAATYDPATNTLAVVIDQGESAFAVDVPLRICFDDAPCDELVVSLSEPRQTVAVEVERRPRSVELDPDYHVFRKLKPGQIMPTTAMTKAAEKLIVVVPPGELLEPYDMVAGDFRKAVEKKEHETATIVADEGLTAEMLADGGVLVVGEAVKHPAVQELLARTQCTLRWDDAGFAVGDQRFDGDRHAVLCTVHHPDNPKVGVTVYYGNSADALANARLLGYYSNSLLVFEANGRTRVVLRHDYESHERIDVAVVQ